MGLFKPLLHLKSKPQPISQPAPAARLDQLPTEILLQIIGYAEPVSAIALTLSCKRIYRLIGDHHIKFGIFRKLDLVQLLKRDLPNHIICPYCLKLHKVKVGLKARREIRFSRTRIMEEVRTVACWRGGVERRVDLRDLRQSGPGLSRIL